MSPHPLTPLPPPPSTLPNVCGESLIFVVLFPPLWLPLLRSLSVGNLCLRYVDASFYQVARGLVLPATVMFALAQANPPSKMAIVSCVIVTAGFLIGCSGLTLVGGKGEKGVTA